MEQQVDRQQRQAQRRSSTHRLGRINGHNGNAKEARRRRRRNGFDAHRPVLGLVHAVEEGENARVGGRVSETREGSLKEGRQDTAVEARNAAVGVQRSEGDGETCAVAVLVVDLCADINNI